MGHAANSTIRHTVTMGVIAGILCSSTGCAPIAHRSSYSYAGKESVTSCESASGVCPWLVGDALLLLPGIVPGVVAFIVDFSTGAWRHDDFAAAPGGLDCDAAKLACERPPQPDNAPFEADEYGSTDLADLEAVAQGPVGH